MKTQYTYKHKIIRMVIMLLTTLFAFISTNAQVVPPPDRWPDWNSENQDKTLSPYFFVKSDDPSTDQLPLKETGADVNIAGVIADVKITQVYKNEGENTLEAIYIFPASTRAAVYSMKMTIGEREIIAIIQEKQKARENYEQAREEGKTASLLEQMRPNVFQMNVANILPGDVIKVELNYTELLIPEKGVYEFVYPTVVGPRYSNTRLENVTPDEKWVGNPYTTEGKDPYYTFDISIGVSAGLPIQDIRCTTHKMSVDYENQTSATLSLDPEEQKGGNRDCIIQYRLTGNKIESGLLLHKGAKENFFLAMIQPPESVRNENIPPREYVFIVDVSGSMYGFPLDISKKLMRDLIGNLKPTDKFNILLFAGGSELFSEQSVNASKENVSKALQFIDSQRGGGGTELLPALKRALSLKGTEDFSRSFVIATDGYVTVEKEAFDLIRNNLGQANFFTFGIGSSVNRYLLEGMAHVGTGEAFIIINQNEASEKANKFRKYIQSPVLTNIKLHFEGFDAYDVEPVSVPDVLSEKPVIIYGKWKGKPAGKIILTGESGLGKYEAVLNAAKNKPKESNSALRYLWARERIRLLDDYISIGSYSDDHATEITELGLKYNLLTNYTSFIAIDSEIRNEEGNITTVKQPLPLPDGVSNYAVGGVYAVQGIATSPRTAQKSGSGKRIKGFTMAFDAENEISLEDDPAEKKEKDVYTTVEKMPEFPGDSKGLKEFILKNLRYPDHVKNKGISGNVFIEFIVDTDGSVIEVTVLRSIHPELDKEAIRVIKLTSKMWKPGRKKGKAVKVRMVIPVKFS